MDILDESHDSDQYSEFDLMLELAHRPPQLRRVSPSELPACIGGRKPDLLSYLDSSQMTPLQRDFLQGALRMHQRVRPNFLEFSVIRTSVVENESLHRVMKELRQLWHMKGLTWEGTAEGTTEGTTEGTSEGTARLKFQLEHVIDSHPGWRDLQAEIRTRNLKLQPVVDIFGFYVVRKPSGRQF